MDNWKVTDKYNMTCVVLAHNAEHAILRHTKCISSEGLKQKMLNIFENLLTFSGLWCIMNT